jgi:hypothetical protein
MSTANTAAATENSSEAPSIVIEQSHRDEAETGIKLWAQLTQDSDFLDFINGATLEEILERATTRRRACLALLRR